MTDRPADAAGGHELPPTLAASDSSTGLPDGDLVGRVLGGRYRILRKLGEGAMGAVYLGEHLKIGRQDAIKVLRDALATDPDTIARFVRGTRNVSMIRHPNICTIYDYSDIAGGIQFVAMEFVPGETLRDFLQREGKLSIETAVHIARQAAEALDAAHEVGIVHRDLKPANIMVVPGRSGALDVKVVDFDIAKGSSDGEGEEVTRMGFVVGTPEYMSPEQLIGDRLDGRSDIYSLGLVLFRMITGTLPFAAEDTQDLMVKRLTEDPMSLADALPSGAFPPALEAAVRRSLQRKPAERQATAGEFGREISAAIATPGTIAVGGHAPPIPDARAAAVGTGRKEPGISKAMMVGGAVGAIAVAATAAFFLMNSAPEPVEPQPIAAADSPSAIIQYSDPVIGEQDDPEEPSGGATAPPVTPPASNSAGTTTPVAPSGTPDPAPDIPTMDELFTLLDRVGPPSPGPAALQTVHDEAVAAWGQAAAPANTRAMAAYVAASALLPMGDTMQAVQWLERAVELRPDYGPFRSELETYRQLVSGY